MIKSIVTGIQAKQPALQVISSAIPVLFAEGTKMDEIKAELKSPEIYVFAGLLVGQLIALYVANKAAAAAAAAPAAPAAPAAV